MTAKKEKIPGSEPLKTGHAGKHEIFCNEYLVDLNGTQAAIRAKYAAHSADVTASKLLRNPKVKERVDFLKAERAERTKVTADSLLIRLSEEINADFADLFDDDGKVLPIKQWPLIWRQGLVSGIDVQQVTALGMKMAKDKAPMEGAEVDLFPAEVLKIKLSDRLKRIELAGKHIGVNAFNEKQTVEFPGLDAIYQQIVDLTRGLPRASCHSKE